MISLVIDPNPGTAKQFREILDRTDFKSTCISDLSETKNFIKNNYYSLVLIHGVKNEVMAEIIDSIKKSHYCSKAVIALVLENTESENIHFFLDSGIDEIIFHRENTDQFYFRLLNIQKRIKEKKYYEDDLSKNRLNLAEFNSLTENAPDGVVTINKDGAIVFANKAVTEIFGYEKQELLGANISILMPEPDRSAHNGYIKSYHSGKPPKIIGQGREVPGLKKDGTIFPIRIAVNEFFVEGEKYFLGIISDITERVEMEEKLRLTEKFFRDQYRGIPYPISTWKRIGDDFELIDYNEAAFAFTKGRIKENLNKKFKELYHYPEIFNCLETAFKSKTSITKEINQNITIDSNFYNFVVSFVYIPPDLLIIHTIDNTEKNKMESVLKDKEERLRKITDNLPAFIAYVDKEERYQFINKTYRDFLNRQSELIIGRKIRDLLGEKGYPEEHVKNVLSGKLVQFENSITLQNQKKCFFVTYVPDIDPSGEVKGFYSLITDITEQKSFQEKLLKAREEANQANNAKSAFLANMSHELRTPLNSILGYAQILTKDSTLGDKQRKAVNSIFNSGEYLLMLITDILDLSKIEANRMELQLHPFYLNDLFNEIFSIINPALKEKDISFQYMLPDENIKLIGDKKRIQQILLNLLSNAIKFTSIGYVYFLSDLTIINNHECEILFRVKDTGIGLEENQLKEIFNPFSQFGSGPQKEKGTGLGLLISMKLAKLMNSEIFVESKFGKGSLFYFKLRLQYIAAGKEGAVPPIPEPERKILTPAQYKNIIYPEKIILAELKELSEKGEYSKLMEKCSELKINDSKYQSFIDALESSLNNFDFEGIIKLIGKLN